MLLFLMLFYLRAWNLVSSRNILSIYTVTDLELTEPNGPIWDLCADSFLTHFADFPTLCCRCSSLESELNSDHPSGPGPFLPELLKSSSGTSSSVSIFEFGPVGLEGSS